MYNQSMVVYGELLFIENLIIGAVLLYLTGEICGKNMCRMRIFIGSIMCGAFSLVIFIGVNGIVMLVMEGLFAGAVCEVSFGFSGSDKKEKAYAMIKARGRTAVTFILTTYFVGGITMGLLLLAGQQGIYTAAGIYTGDMKAAMLAAFICLSFITTKHIIKTVKNKKMFAEHSYDAEITIGGHIFKAKAFLDTGNRLRDPISGKPAAVASERLWERLWAQMIDEDMRSRLALIPYESVGSGGMMEAVRSDYIQLGDRRIGGCPIARSSKGFSLGEDSEYDLLISGEMVGMGNNEMY